MPDELPQSEFKKVDEHAHDGKDLNKIKASDLEGKIDLATQSEGTISLTTQVTGTLPIANGGTGQTTATAAFDALAPTITQGDTIYHNGSDNVRLAKGTAYQTIQMNSTATALEWGSIIPPYQKIALPSSYSIANTSLVQVASDSTGDNIYIAAINEAGTDTLNVYRLQKDSITGMYLYKGSPIQLTHGVDVTLSGYVGVVAGDTYVWVIALNTAGSDILIRRYAKDLTGAQNMTISGSAETTLGPALGNDSAIYVQSGTLGGSSTQWKSYSISGTTATNTGNVVRSDSVSRVTGGFFDGTSLYVVDYNSSFNPVKEYNTSGTVVSTTTTGLFTNGSTLSDLGAPVGLGYGGSGRLYMYSLSTAHATASTYFLEMYLITKP